MPANKKAPWLGSLTVPGAGEYWLHLHALATDAGLSIDGRVIAATGAFQGDLHGDILQANQDNVLPTTDGLDNLRRAVQLTAVAHPITVTISPDTSNNPVQIRRNWYTPEQRQADHDSAIAAAKHAKIAVVYAWSRRAPFFELSRAQDQLIEDVAAVNPNTVVVLNTSQPVALPWVNRVKAILEMWWPGDEGGWATASLLLGNANPAGRLPMTWAKRLEDYPASDPRSPELAGKAADHRTTYGEGLNIGYRWFHHEKIEPLFPFGYGLSHTAFEYSGRHVERAADGGLTVSFRIANTGKRDGDEIPQVYLGAPRENPYAVAFPIRSLAAFDRLSLKAGKSRTVSLHVIQCSLQYWSTADQRWEPASHNRSISVGPSSKEPRLEQSIDVE